METNFDERYFVLYKILVHKPRRNDTPIQQTLIPIVEGEGYTDYIKELSI